MKKLIVLLSILCFNVQADEISILFGGNSQHIKPKRITVAVCEFPPCQQTEQDYNYNEDHNLIGIKYNDIILTKYTNSFYRDSYLLAYSLEVSKTLKPILGMDHTFSIVGGVVTGYKQGEITTAFSKDFSLYLSPSIGSRININDQLSFSVNTGMIGLFEVVSISASLNYKF